MLSHIFELSPAVCTSLRLSPGQSPIPLHLSVDINLHLDAKHYRNEYGKKMKSSWSNNKNVSIVVLWKNTLFSPLTNTYTCTTFSMDIGLKLLAWNGWNRMIYLNTLYVLCYIWLFLLVIMVASLLLRWTRWGGEVLMNMRNLSICLYFWRRKKPTFFFNLFVIWYSSIWY